MTKFAFDLVGFDLDGTLLDTGADLTAAVNHALATRGYGPFPVETIRPFIGKGAQRMLARALQESGEQDEALVDALLPILLDHYAANIAVHTQPYPGLIDAMDALSARGVRLAVCTNKREALARSLLDQLGLTPRFAAIVGGDTLGPNRMKPLPDLLLDMVEKAGGGRTIFLGDTDNDTLAARAAAIPSIAVSFGFVPCTAEEIGADAGIDHYDELVPLLERWTV
ncbi:phosphoglycolate phosphatase [Sphingobium sp. B11D3B]|uniref:HAD-IA family hydrolase n=1 Tax=Sphingobium sp. B11D3B TaxID=2940575 RepID=UPI00222769BE|nr:HAD-IA family hydrolase [Sphingobium sp. B11D3B]MCW2387501.1 phosphoglycolate phosphatase [Sphingobium sp. B11D3B]